MTPERDRGLPTFGALTIDKAAFRRAVQSIALAGTFGVANVARAQPLTDPTQARVHHDAGVKGWTSYAKSKPKDLQDLVSACAEFDSATKLLDTDASYFLDLAVCRKAEATGYLKDPGYPADEAAAFAADARNAAFQAAQRALATAGASPQMRKDAQKIIDETTCHLRLVVPSDWSEYKDKIAIVGADEKETPIVVERWNVDTPFTPGNYQLKLEHTHSWISHATSRPLPLPEGTALAAFNCLGDAKSPTVLDVAALFKDNLDPPEKHDVAAATAAPAVAPASDKPVGSSVPVTETPPGCQCRSGRAGGTEASYRGLVALALSLSAFFRRRRPRPAAPMAESRPSERSRIDDGP